MKKLNITVCVKQTVDKEINPFDACALEEALRIKNADVTVLCMGPESAEETLKGISRLGVKKCVLLTDPLLAGSDTFVTAYALSLAIKHSDCAPDMIFCGRQSVDGDTAQVGPELSAALGYNLITNVLKISKIDGAASDIECVTRFGLEACKMPCLLTIERINSLRFPRMGAKCAEVVRLNCADIGADPEKCGLRASPTKVMKTFESSLGRRKCKFITLSEIAEIIEKEAMSAKENVEVLSEKQNGKKLPLVWCVGNAPTEKARSVAEEIRIIDEKLSPIQIAELAKKEKPEVILWNSDFLGRKNAPQVAYMLSTGLCADCTSLETDGEKLYMFRPAFSGSIMAKIQCRTLPQMATVRSSEKNAEKVILSPGLGALACFEELRNIAKVRGYGFGASRALVDKLGLEYELQIGLTGKSVCPDIYFCVGISGAVQHTCAIERAKCVIAVNTDKSARIFEYADYGIVADAKELVNALKI